MSDVKCMRRLALLATLGLTLLAATAPAASAGESQRIKTNGGTAVFDDLGELVVATDDRADHLGVMANLTWSDGSVTAYASGAGKDQTRTSRSPRARPCG